MFTKISVAIDSFNISIGDKDAIIYFCTSQYFAAVMPFRFFSATELPRSIKCIVSVVTYLYYRISSLQSFRGNLNNNKKTQAMHNSTHRISFDVTAQTYKVTNKTIHTYNIT